jgi:tetraacyldisaccharide 4'-kinase
VTLSDAPAPSRAPWQLLYGAMLATRRRRAASRARHLPVPVISVGNLHWGGGGKTPFTIAVAAGLSARGRRVAILSRGYGRSSRGAQIVSRGQGAELDVEQAGDEPFLMAEQLDGVAVVVGEQRYAAGELALAELGRRPDLFVLDDGFSHVRLARNLDLLLFPAADPWAGGRLLPSGRLREPLSAVRHADAVVLSGAKSVGNAGGELARALASHGYSGPGYASATIAGAPRLASGEALAPGSPVYALAAIARPAAFFAAVRASGLEVVGAKGFRDHHPYSELDLRAIERDARAATAGTVLTTEKDVAKLAGRIGLDLAVLPIEARPEPGFWRWLEARLEGMSN